MLRQPALGPAEQGGGLVIGTSIVWAHSWVAAGRQSCQIEARLDPEGPDADAPSIRHCRCGSDLFLSLSTKPESKHAVADMPELVDDLLFHWRTNVAVETRINMLKYLAWKPQPAWLIDCCHDINTNDNTA